METKVLLFCGDRLHLIAGEGTPYFNYSVEVLKAKPLHVNLLHSVSESDINKLNAAGDVVLADSGRGYAYKAKIASMSGEDIELSLLGRHEDREFFRVDTVVSMGYEIVRKAPGQIEKKVEDNSSFDKLKSMDGEGDDQQIMAQLMYKMYDEVRKLREQVQKETRFDTSILSQRVVSLSGSGIRFTSSIEVDKGDILRLSIMLPGRDRPLIFTAKVIRVEVEMGGVGKTNLSVACRYKEISESCKESLVRFVFQTQREMLRRR